METYVSVVNWSGDPRPDAGDVRAAIRRQDKSLRGRGLHSVAILHDGDDCSAIIVSTVRDRAEVRSLAASILPGAAIELESMRFDDAAASPVWIGDEARDYLDAVLEAVATE